MSDLWLSSTNMATSFIVILILLPEGFSTQNFHLMYLSLIIHRFSSFTRSDLPWSRRFFLSCERATKMSSEAARREKPLVTLDLNLTFMQTPGSGSDPQARIG